MGISIMYKFKKCSVICLQWPDWIGISFPSGNMVWEDHLGFEDVIKIEIRDLYGL